MIVAPEREEAVRLDDRQIALTAGPPLVPSVEPIRRPCHTR